MNHKNVLGLAFLASVAVSAALAGGACGDSVPSDQGKGGNTTTTTTTSATASSSSGTGGKGTGGTGTGGAGTGGTGGSGGAPDCFNPPLTTYVEIINACTNAQAVDVTPVLPLLTADGGLPALP